ncbi:MAG: hypothetical protein ABIJ09_12845 [Pseudomonadota bacterium]
MPRRKKLDISSVMEAFLAEIDARVGRALADAVRDLHQRIDRLERNLSGRGSKESAVHSFRVCRKPGCNSRVIAHGLCSRHYQQWRYHRRKAEAKSTGPGSPSSATPPRKDVAKPSRTQAPEHAAAPAATRKRARPGARSKKPSTSSS